MKFIFLLIASSICLATTAQNIDSNFQELASNYPPEKVFIHFDKSVYSKGETIWFKGYLYDGSLPSEQSKNFYVDWYNAKGELVQHGSYPIFSASARGQFNVPENYSGTELQIKAYTTWMLNFDSAFLYKKSITILQNNLSKKAVNTVKTTVGFYPEGGNLVAGIGSFVAFKATNQFGEPVAITGIIKNAKNEIIDSIKTEHDGMGTVYLSDPKPDEKYTACWKDEWNMAEQTTQLPAVTENGLTLQIQQTGNEIVVTINRNKDASDDKKYLKLYGFADNNVLLKADIKLTGKTSQTIQIDSKKIPTGIVQFTLFNANNVPMAERIAFINHQNFRLNPTLNTLEINLSKRKKNIIEVAIDDTAFTNMSVAVTDASIAIDSTTNIFSQLLLSSNIKGYVHNPAYYFSNTNENTQQHLDLVMLTNGWRKYNWQQVMQNKMPSVRFKKESSYLQLLGNVFGLDKNDLLQQKMIVFLQGKDSSKKEFILSVAKDGSFKKSNLLFFDTLKAFYSLGNPRLNRLSEVAFGNDLYNNPSKYNVDTIIQHYSSINYAFMQKQKAMDSAYKKLAALKGSGVLSEVTVQTNRKTKLEAMDEEYTSGMFNMNSDAYQFDVTNDMRAQSAMSVFSYLQGAVAGLQINTSGGETEVKWRMNRTDLFLNEMHTDVATIETLNMNDVAYIKVFKPPFFGGFGGSPGGAIAIYTRKGGDIKLAPGKGLSFKYVQGYTAYKEFYQPNYDRQNDASQPDIRTTLYWNPYLIADATKKKAIISFYNNDVTKKFRLVLCGMNAEGKMVWLEKIID